MPSLTYENLEASNGHLSCSSLLLSADSLSSDCCNKNSNHNHEYYEEVDFRNGVAHKAADDTKKRKSSFDDGDSDDDDQGRAPVLLRS